MTAASIVGPVGITRAAAASSAPAVHVSTRIAKVGQLVQVTGTGWSPVGDTVQIEVCGQDALNLSDDCDQADQYSAAIRSGGIFYGAVVTHLPPSPCPCVVLVSLRGAFSGVSVPITIPGAPTVPIPPHLAASSAPVVLSAKILTPVSVGAWFGAPRGVILMLRITNRSTSDFEFPALSVTVGRGRNPSDFVVAGPLAPLHAKATQVLRIPVTLPALTIGHYSVRAQVITGQGQVARVFGTSSYPWALFLLAALILQALLLLLRNRLRARLGRAGETGPTAEEAVPVEVIDLRLPAELPAGEPAHEGAAEQVEAIDLRTPAALPAEVWTVAHRLAVPLPEQGLTCRVEVLACPSVRLQRTTILVWSDFAVSPWDALHEGTVWAEMDPEGPLNALVHGEAFSYDGHGLHLELNVSVVGPELTFDENRAVIPVRVQGSVALGDVTTPVDVESGLEQTWVVDPPDGVFMTSSELPVGSLTYGQAVGGDAFYLRFKDDDEPDGWLLKDGRLSAVVRADRRVDERTGPYPHRLTLEFADELGRQAVATGTASNGMAFREAGSLILECRTDWILDGVPALGEDRSEIDLDTWRSATRAAFHAMTQGNSQTAVLVGHMTPWPTNESWEPLWQREPVEEGAPGN